MIGMRTEQDLKKQTLPLGPTVFLAEQIIENFHTVTQLIVYSFS